MAENKNQIATLDQKIAQAGSVRELFQLPDVRDRFIKNYEAVSGRKDGENRLEQERFAYLQLLAEKPELQQVDKFFHFSALVYAGTTGLSFRDNKLYVMANGKGGLKVQTSPAGKREMFLMMKEIKECPEAVLVMDGDVFIHDKLNNIVKEHYGTDKSVDKISLDNIKAVYQRLKYKDGTIKDTVVYRDDLVKAKSKSKMTGDNSTWNTWPGEMSKKVAINRAFRLYHHYPDNVVVYGNHDDDDSGAPEITDAKFIEEPTDPTVVQTASGENVDTSTGEVHEAEVIEPKDTKTKKKDKPQVNLMDED